tara:strand:- start:51 stop:1865 length:1815 start_codon:yes stop_codon:yes gene_type:complete
MKIRTGKMGMNPIRMAELLESQSQELPSDQIYRELIVNAMEACVKQKKLTPNYKGEIRIEPKTETPNKFTITDNGIGMPKSKIVSLLKNFGETEEQSENGNMGHGTKVAAMCTNPKGVIYESYRKGEDYGSAVVMHKGEEGYYGPREVGNNREERCDLDLDKQHKVIKKYGHGTSVTLLGKSNEENTTKVPTNYKQNSLLGSGRMGERFLLSFANVKFFTIPDAIQKFIVVWNDQIGSSSSVKGHKYYLDKHSQNSGTMDLSNAKLYWWIRNENFNSNKSTHHVTNGQLSYLNNNEIMNIKYNCAGRKNPLRSWGLPFSDNRVILIIEPINFKMTSMTRSSLKCMKTGLDYKKFEERWKDEFIEKMPQPIMDLESKLEKEKVKEEVDLSLLGKQIAKDLKDTFAFPSNKGKETVGDENITLRGGGYPNREHDTNISDTPSNGSLPGTGFGDSLINAALKNTVSKRKAEKTYLNIMPKIQHVKDISSVRIQYDERENLIRFNTEMDLIEEYLNAANILKPQKETAKKVLCNLMTMEIGSVIAYFKGRIFKEYSEDEKTAVLQEENLVTLLLNKPRFINDLKKSLQTTYKKSMIIKEREENVLYEQ